jgi:hypothetical protein
MLLSAVCGAASAVSVVLVINRHQARILDVVGANWISTALFATIALGIATDSVAPAIGGFLFAVMLNIAFMPIIFAAWQMRRRRIVRLPVDLTSAAWGGSSAFVCTSYLFDSFRAGWSKVQINRLTFPAVTLLGSAWNVVCVRFIGWWNEKYGSAIDR